MDKIPFLALLALLAVPIPAGEPEIYMESCQFLLSDKAEEQAPFLPFLPKWKATPRCILSLHLDPATEGDIRLRQLATEVEVTDGTGKKLPLVPVKKADVFAVNEIWIGLAELPTDGNILLKGQVRYSVAVKTEPIKTEISFTEPTRIPHPELEMTITPLPKDESIVEKQKARGVAEEYIHFLQFDIKDWEGNMSFGFTEKDGRICSYRPYRFGEVTPHGVRSDCFYIITNAPSVTFTVAPITKPVEGTIPLDFHITTQGRLLKGKPAPGTNDRE